MDNKWNISYNTKDRDNKSNDLQVWNNLLNQLEKRGVINYKVKEIIISEHYESDFRTLTEDSGNPVSKRGFISSAKHIATDKGEIFLFNSLYLNINNVGSIKTIINQFVDVTVPSLIEKTLPFVNTMITEFRENKKNSIDKIYYTLAFWQLKEIVLNEIKFTCNEKPYTAVTDRFSDFITVERSLQRDMKKAHFEFQTNHNIEQFWSNLVDTFAFHLEQLLTVPKYATPIKSPLKDLINSFMDFTGQNEPAIIIAKIDENLTGYLNSIGINLSISSNGQYEIHTPEHPQKLYKQKGIVDTEERLICFLDVLGFKNIIKEYDSDISSTALQDFKDALTFAYENILNLKGIQPELEYKTFSDNVLISTPFYSEEDKHTKLFIITSTIIGFSNALMAKGFYVRGGLCTGSYYSDENMIFSGGLVKSYELEQNRAVYPRVIIDDSLVETITNFTEIQTQLFPWSTLFVKDKLDEEFFINTFDSMLYPHRNLEYMQKSVNDAFEDIDDDPLLNKIKDLSLLSLSSTFEILTAETSPQEIISWLKGEIKYQINKHLDKKYIKKKYLWLLQFVEWLNDENKNYEYVLSSGISNVEENSKGNK